MRFRIKSGQSAHRFVFHRTPAPQTLITPTGGTTAPPVAGRTS